MSPFSIYFVIVGMDGKKKGGMKRVAIMFRVRKKERKKKKKRRFDEEVDKKPKAFGRERKGNYAPHVVVLLHEILFLDVVHVLNLHALVFFYIYLKYACASINTTTLCYSLLLDSLTRLLSTPPFLSHTFRRNQFFFR